MRPKRTATQIIYDSIMSMFPEYETNPSEFVIPIDKTVRLETYKLIFKNMKLEGYSRSYCESQTISKQLVKLSGYVNSKKFTQKKLSYFTEIIEKIILGAINSVYNAPVDPLNMNEKEKCVPEAKAIMDTIQQEQQEKNNKKKHTVNTKQEAIDIQLKKEAINLYDDEECVKMLEGRDCLTFEELCDNDFARSLEEMKNA
jgi:hypothetical protein